MIYCVTFDFFLALNSDILEGNRTHPGVKFESENSHGCSRSIGGVGSPRTGKPGDKSSVVVTQTAEHIPMGLSQRILWTRKSPEQQECHWSSSHQNEPWVAACWPQLLSGRACVQLQRRFSAHQSQKVAAFMLYPLFTTRVPVYLS